MRDYTLPGPGAMPKQAPSGTPWAMYPRRVLLALLGLLLLSGCPRKGPDRPAVVQGPGYRAVTLHDPELLGVSGLAVEGEDLLVVTEHQQRFLRLSPTPDGAYRVAANKPVLGVKEARDLEAIARLGPGRYAIGTETDGRRKKDRVHFLVESEDALTSTRSVSLRSKKLFGLRIKDNQGIEGLCAADGYLVAGLETVKVDESGGRFAPVAVLPPGGELFAPAWVRLLTPTGKLSSLSCRRAEDDLEVLGIERHFGVMRVIRFRLPLRPTGEVVEAELYADLEAAYRTLGEPNFEGLERLEGGRLVLVSDNDHGGRTGPTVILVVAEPGGG